MESADGETVIDGMDCALSCKYIYILRNYQEGFWFLDERAFLGYGRDDSIGLHETGLRCMYEALHCIAWHGAGVGWEIASLDPDEDADALHHAFMHFWFLVFGAKQHLLISPTTLQNWGLDRHPGVLHFLSGPVSAA